jgi:hypothetical protein
MQSVVDSCAVALRSASPRKRRFIEMKRLFNFFALLVAGAVVAGTLMAQTQPSFVGTWKLNLAKSKYEGTSAPKSLTRTVTAEGQGLKYSFEGEAADGSKISYGFTTKLDGKDSAITGVGMPAGADAVALEKPSVHHISGVLKKGGAKIGSVSSAISPDGKTVTVNTKAKIDGKEVKTEQVYEKQ